MTDKNTLDMARLWAAPTPESRRKKPMSWDDPDLEPDRDPMDGRMVPCVVCMASPQVGGRGVCSPECEADLENWTSAHPHPNREENNA